MSEQSERVWTLTQHIMIDHLENMFEDQVPRRWDDYVDETWVRRQVRKFAAQYSRDTPVVAEVVAAVDAEIIHQHMQPTHCRGQRRFKLVA